MHDEGMLMRIRTSLHIDDFLLNNAAKLTGVKEKILIGAHGLEALIAKRVPAAWPDLRDRERSSRDSEMAAERETIVRTLVFYPQENPCPKLA